MKIALFVAMIISAIWFLYYSARAGWYGVHIKRRLSYGIDKDESEKLMRIITRYRIGEFNVKKKYYGGLNLLFTKPANSVVRYNESMYYVNIENALSRSFGWISTEPHITSLYGDPDDEIDKSKNGISNEAFDELIKLLEELFPDTTKLETKKTRSFNKSKNEEVHLS
ncbi:hypothetical protein [Yersinia phage fHe-Yen9-03]|uniref:Uncharacterized protein n=1 Tax=Yersinia phage fHe-Yen9-03 TaxID=2052743 RepID=A0A2C9D035_9CAUD|nr:hypothetical protein [Yersinia phage fHe-Yen9-03]